MVTEDRTAAGGSHFGYTRETAAALGFPSISGEA